MAPFSPAAWGIPVVQSTIDRVTQFPNPAVDFRVFNKETGNIERWDGTIWVVDLVGGGSVPVTDGATDLAVQLQAIINATPLAGTLTVPPSDKVYVIGTALSVPRSMTIDLTGVTLQVKASAVMTEMLTITDVDRVFVVGGTFDCNNVARTGPHAKASTRSPDTFECRGTRVINAASGAATDHGGFMVDSSDSGATKRYQNVKLTGCRARTFGTFTLGALIAYADYVTLIDWAADTIGFHGFEFIGCTQVKGDVLRGKNCAGSGAAIGDHSQHFEMTNIIVENCSGDGAITVENTCSYGKVMHFRALDCAKPGLNLSFGTAGTAPNDTVRGVEIAHGTLVARTPLAITSITKAANAVVTTAIPHRFNWINHLVSFMGVVGMTEINGLSGTVTVIDATHFSVDINSSAFSTYTSGGVVGIYQPGVNAFITSPSLGTNIRFNDIDVDSFNRVIDMRYMSGSSARDLRGTNLQGPSTYVALFQEIQRSHLRDITCADSQCTHANGAFQFTSLGSVHCDDVHAAGLYAFLCQLPDNVTYTPLCYVEGTGTVYFDHLRTQGAMNYVSTPAGASPGIALRGGMGQVNGAQIGGAGLPRVTQQSGNWAGQNDFTVIDGRKVAARTSAPVTGDVVPDWTLGDAIINKAPAVASPKGWRTTVNGTLKTALVAITGSITTGTKALTVSSASTLAVGNYITIAGVTGTKQIAAIAGTAVTLNSTADATVTGAAVQYATPTFVSEGNL